MTKLVILTVAVLGAWAQDTTGTLLAHVDFVTVEPGKSALYHEAMQQKVLPKVKERMKSGEQFGIVTYSRLFPHPGSQEVRMALGRKLRDVSAGTTDVDGFPKGLFHTQQGELWRLRHSVNIEKFLQSAVVRALFMRVKPGKSLNDIVELYKEGAKDLSRDFTGQAMFDRTFHDGDRTNSYFLVVLWSYESLDHLDDRYNHRTRPAEAALTKKLGEVRDLMRVELWTRRSESLVPNP